MKNTDFTVYNDISIPTVIEQRGHREYSYDIYSRLLNDRIVFLDSEVNHATASVIVAQMLFLEAQDADKDKCDVSTICLGLAASMAAFLLATGKKGKRYALPCSEIMIHQPLSEFQGQASDIKIRADKILCTRAKLNGILAANTGKSIEDIEAATERDNYMTANQALDFGLIDSIYNKRN